MEVFVVFVVLVIKNDTPDLSFFPSPLIDCTFLIDRPNFYDFEMAVLFDDEVIGEGHVGHCVGAMFIHLFDFVFPRMGEIKILNIP